MAECRFEEGGGNFVVLLVGFLRKKGNRTLLRALDEFLEGSRVLFAVVGLLISESLAKQFANAGPDKRIRDKSSLDGLNRESCKRFS